jgi:RNA polymerase primary sigma factor
MAKKQQAQNIFSMNDSECQIKMTNLFILSKDNGGYITHEHIIDEFQYKKDDENFQLVLSACNTMKIKVYEDEPLIESVVEIENPVSSGPAVAMIDDEEVVIEVDFVIDPTKQYLKEMGSTPLLSRLEEIRVAKKIEEGHQMMMRAISACPMLIESILDLAEKVKNEEIKIEDVVDGFADSEGDEVSLELELLVSKADEGLKKLKAKKAEISDDSEEDEMEIKPGETAEEVLDISDDEDGVEDPLLKELESATVEVEEDSRITALIKHQENLDKIKFAVISHLDKVGVIYKELQVILKKKGSAHSDFQNKQIEIANLLTEIRFTPTQIEALCSQFEEKMAIVKKHENKIYEYCVNVAEMPRATFLQVFPGNETDPSWLDKEIKAKQPYSKKLSNAKEEVVKLHKKITEIESELKGIKIQQFRNLHRQMTVGEKKMRIGKENMTKGNLRLVVSIAKKYLNRGMQMLDLIQEGNIGLMKAVDKFDYRRGYKFSTYATWWIRQAITRCLADQSRVIRLPVHLIEYINKIKKITNEHLQKHGREPDITFIAEKLDLEVSKVSHLMRVAKDPYSLENTVSDDGESTFADFLEDTNTLTPEQSMEKDQLRDTLEEALQGLTLREAKVIRMRFGMGIGTDHTLEEIGNQFDVTRERIRQIEAKALQKLKSTFKSGKFKGLYEGRIKDDE